MINGARTPKAGQLFRKNIKIIEKIIEIKGINGVFSKNDLKSGMNQDFPGAPCQFRDIDDF
jgi:hypothetical protein